MNREDLRPVVKTKEVEIIYQAEYSLEQVQEIYDEIKIEFDKLVRDGFIQITETNYLEMLDDYLGDCFEEKLSLVKPEKDYEEQNRRIYSEGFYFYDDCDFEDFNESIPDMPRRPFVSKEC